MLEDLKECNSWRKELPAEAVSFENVGIWNVLKQAVGKDLTRITIPIVYCEPLSFLQRLAEYLEYFELLNQADQCNEKLQRLELVTAFVVSTMTSNHKRMTKPFNPLLFETFELDRSNQEGYRFVAEQVSHHPPISAFYSEAPAFEFYGTVSPRIRFWGVSLEIQTGGTFTLKLIRHNEIYTWDSINCNIRNIIIGGLYLTLEGTINMRCSSGIQVKLKIGKDGSDLLEGYAYNSDKKLTAFYGKWTSFLACCSPNGFEKKYRIWQEKIKEFAEEGFPTRNVNSALIDGSSVLWRTRPRPLSSEKMYNFTRFTLLLNDPAFIIHDLPKTDSRLRPDIRLFEERKVDEAAEEKNRLEIKQREARSRDAKNHIKSIPRWFNKQNTKNGKVWMFNKKYWERKYETCEDIF